MKKFAIFIILLIAVIVGGTAYFYKFGSPIREQAATPEQIPAKENSAGSSVEAKTGQPKQIAPADGENVTATAPSLAASLKINGQKFDTTVAAGSSVYDLMEKLKKENKISFNGKNFSGLGFFVEEINGVKNDPIGKNWIYYVNGRPAPVGVSNYQIKNNDLIEWKYEKKSF